MLYLLGVKMVAEVGVRQGVMVLFSLQVVLPPVGDLTVVVVLVVMAV